MLANLCGSNMSVDFGFVGVILQYFECNVIDNKRSFSADKSSFYVVQLNLYKYQHELHAFIRSGRWIYIFMEKL